MLPLTGIFVPDIKRQAYPLIMALYLKLDESEE